MEDKEFFHSVTVGMLKAVVERYNLSDDMPIQVLGKNGQWRDVWHWDIVISDEGKDRIGLRE